MVASGRLIGSVSRPGRVAGAAISGKIPIVAWHSALCRARHCPVPKIKFQNVSRDAVQPLHARPFQPIPRAYGMGFNRDVRDEVKIIGGYSRLQEIAERVLHIKQLTDHWYIFPAGEEDLEQEWFDSNVARLKQILEDIPVKLTSANFSDGQKMVMLDRQHPNSIHLAIRDAADQKGAGLYDFMIGLTGRPDDYLYQCHTNRDRVQTGRRQMAG